MQRPIEPRVNNGYIDIGGNVHIFDCIHAVEDFFLDQSLDKIISYFCDLKEKYGGECKFYASYDHWDPSFYCYLQTPIRKEEEWERRDRVELERKAYKEYEKQMIEYKKWQVEDLRRKADRLEKDLNNGKT